MTAPEIFISYKSERRRAVRHLSQILTRRGYVTWFDDELNAGDDFRERILENLDNARVVIVLWCSKSIKSTWVLEEAERAELQGKLLPCRIEACRIPRKFGKAHFVDLEKWNGDPRSGAKLDELIAAIEQRLGTRPSPASSDLKSDFDTWHNGGSHTLKDFPPVASREPEKSWPWLLPLSFSLLTMVALAVVLGLYFTDPVDRQIAKIEERDALLQLATQHDKWEVVSRRLSHLGYICVRRENAKLSECQWRIPGAGEPFSECRRCPEMVLLPRSPDGNMIAASVNELTRDEWNSASTALNNPLRTIPPSDPAPVRPGTTDGTLPHAISAAQATAFAVWLSQQTSSAYRLPSNAEWTFMARATLSPGDDLYPTGRDIFPQLANYDPRSVEGQQHFYRGAVTPVRLLQRNAWGLYGLAGNLSEWTADCAESAVQEVEPRCRFQLRGGDWSSPPRDLEIDRHLLPQGGSPGQNVRGGLRLIRTISGTH